MDDLELDKQRKILELEQEKNNKDLQDKYAELERAKAQELKNVQNQIDAIEEQKQKDLEEIEQKIHSIQVVKQAAIDEIKRKQDSIQIEIQKLDSCIIKEEEEQKKLEDMLEAGKGSLDEAIAKTKEKKAAVEHTLLELKEKKERFGKELAEAEVKKKNLESWFLGIEMKDSQRRLDGVNRQITILTQAKAELDKAFGYNEIMDGMNLDSFMEEYRDYFQSTMTIIEGLLDEYSKRYAIVSKRIYEYKKGN